MKISGEQMKIISIVGARPQFIKLAPLCQAINAYNSNSHSSPESRVPSSEFPINHIIVHTGQHFDKEMSDSFFSDLDIAEPDYNLNINSGLHGAQTGLMLIELEKIIIKEQPDLMITFGDTNSTLAGALAGSKLHIPIVHLEAGLRSFNKKMPEEINRIVADHTSDYLFAPTETAVSNLEIEGLSGKTYFTGDIMVDSLKSAIVKSNKRKTLDDLKLAADKYYLLTLHRPYNVDDPANLSNILKEVGKLSRQVVFPAHPRTKKIIEQNNLSIPENILLIKPVGYLDFVKLQSGALKIITDSGGIQKEAYILKKPCVTLRSETEWVETVKSGWNLLINTLAENDYSQKIELFEPPINYENIFGKNVAEKMIDIINDFD